MSQSENIGIQKFFKKISSKGEREYLDYSNLGHGHRPRHLGIRPRITKAIPLHPLQKENKDLQN